MPDSENPRPVPDSIELALNAELSDEALAQLFRESWPGAGERKFSAELEHSLCWVSARLGERLVGFVNVAWNGGEHAFLLDPVVHPEFRRRGVGVALVQRASAAAREAGAAWLHVDYEARLGEFYRRCGFQSTAAGVLALQASSSPPEIRVPPGLTIAPFAPRWLDPCQRLLGELSEWFAPPAMASYAADLGRYASWVATVPGEAGSVLVGCLTLTAPQATAFEVHLLAVARDRHRHGIGRALLRVAERFARRAGAGFLQVKTLGPSSADPFYVRSRAFYLGLGYAPLFESDRLWGTGEPALVLVKAL
jgi:GNAT superfamily N-acetyltransferase